MAAVSAKEHRCNQKLCKFCRAQRQRTQDTSNMILDLFPQLARARKTQGAIKMCLIAGHGNRKQKQRMQTKMLRFLTRAGVEKRRMQ